MIGPKLQCGACGKIGRWRLHCDNDGCDWLVCVCGRSTYSMIGRMQMVKVRASDE